MRNETLRKFAYSWTEPPYIPLSAVTLIVLATGRLSAALIGIAALFWTFTFSLCICRCLKKLLPESGKRFIVIMVSSLIASFFYLILYGINPVMAIESSLHIAVTPFIYCSYRFEKQDGGTELSEIVLPPLSAVFSISVLMFAFALIREPLGYASLSLPGGKAGIIELFNRGGGFPYAVEFIARSAGVLLILGYVLAAFRRINRDRDSGLNPDIKTTAEKSEAEK
ncbi:MAG: hypothetical protein LBD20_07055 [Spirochaetaceae bacterium]|jgi:TRAP-type C4-dicarboxylate transport system permease small subunit|nr:hypothetical protein [Spirochaetaceae bacterium]